jgi:hypothetical protein
MNAKAVAVSYPPRLMESNSFRKPGEERESACPWHHTPPKPRPARPAIPAVASQQVRRAGCARRGKEGVEMHGGGQRVSAPFERVVVGEFAMVWGWPAVRVKDPDH